MGKEIGIDFGTTTTEVSYIDKNGHARSMRLEGKKEVIPTVLYFKSEEEYIIGATAEKKSHIHPKAAVKNFKLYFTDPTKRYAVEAENGDEFTVKPIKAAQLFLNKLIQIIQPKLIAEFGEEGGMIDKAVLTVPAQFDPEEKAAVKNALTKAASQAGFSEIKIAAEPTAAAIAFQEENCEEGETILVYDFGGGTFDVSVINNSDGTYTEIATDGDKRLGGNRLTEKLAEILWVQCLDETDRDYPFEEEEAAHYDEDEYDLKEEYFILNRAEIWNAAEEMKISLLEEEEVEQTVQFYFDNEEDPELVTLELTEKEFFDIIEDDIDKTVRLTERVLQETLNRGDIEKVDELVLAGGSSQIRLIQQKMEQNETLKHLVEVTGDASTLIARGAAKLASVELEVEERTRFEIGTRIVKGKQFDLFEPFIKVGEKLPCSGSYQFYPARENQTEVTIEYYEKDAKNYPDAKKIDDEGINLVNELTISGIPKIAGISIRVTFQIEADGTPTISAEILDQSGNTVKAEQLEIAKRGNLY